MKIMFKQLFALTNIQIFGSALSFALSIVLANQLEPSNFGIYSKALILGNVLSLIGIYGTDHTAPVYATKLKNNQEVFNIVYSIRIVFFIVILAYVPFLLIQNSALALGVFVMCLTVFNLSFLYEISDDNIHYAMTFFGERLIYVFIASLFIITGTLNLYVIFLCFGLATILSISWQIKTYRAFFEQFAFQSCDKIKTAIKNNTFIITISLAEFTYGGFSRLILENRYGLEAMGVYSAGWQSIMVITIFQAQVTKVWRYKISDSLVNKKNGLKELVVNYIKLSTVPVFLFSIFIWIFTDQIVDFLFISNYSSLKSLLPIFACYFIIINLNTLSSIFWVSVDNKKEFLSINLISSIVLIFILYNIPNDLEINIFAGIIIFTHGVTVLWLLTRFYFKHLRSR